jgi:hypothetical protein
MVVCAELKRKAENKNKTFKVEKVETLLNEKDNTVRRKSLGEEQSREIGSDEIFG